MRAVQEKQRASSSRTVTVSTPADTAGAATAQRPNSSTEAKPRVAAFAAPQGAPARRESSLISMAF